LAYRYLEFSENPHRAQQSSQNAQHSSSSLIFLLLSFQGPPSAQFRLQIYLNAMHTATVYVSSVIGPSSRNEGSKQERRQAGVCPKGAPRGKAKNCKRQRSRFGPSLPQCCALGRLQRPQSDNTYWEPLENLRHLPLLLDSYFGKDKTPDE